MKTHEAPAKAADPSRAASRPAAAPASLASLAEVRRILHGPQPVVQREDSGETLRRTCDCSRIGRDPTPSEAASMSRDFPRLRTGDWCVTGPPTNSYNCYGWSVGRTDQFVDAHQIDREFGDGDGQFEISDFDAFYRSRGYLPSSSRRDVALFVSAVGEPQHAARLSGHLCGDQALYESKLGGDFRIAHVLAELEGGMYGNVGRTYGRGMREEYRPWLMAPRLRPAR